MPRPFIVAICGASGVIYGIRFLQVIHGMGLESHLIISEAGKRNIEIETSYNVEDVISLADSVYDHKELTAPPASGSFLTKGMIVIPCTVKTLSGIANSYDDNLIVRAADVTLKEQRKLALVIRETPLHKGHLRLMTLAADMGACILPPIPSFYNRPKSIEDIIDQTLGKALDYFGTSHNLFERWGTSLDDRLKRKMG